MKTVVEEKKVVHDFLQEKNGDEILR